MKVFYLSTKSGRMQRVTRKEMFTNKPVTNEGSLQFSYNGCHKMM